MNLCYMYVVAETFCVNTARCNDAMPPWLGVLTQHSVGTSPAHYAEPGCSSDMLCGAASQINSLTVKLFTVRSWQHSLLEATHAPQKRRGVQATQWMFTWEYKTCHPLDSKAVVEWSELGTRSGGLTRRSAVVWVYWSWYQDTFASVMVVINMLCCYSP